MRIAFRVATMAAALLVALIGHGLLRLFRIRSPWPRWLLGTVARIAGARVTTAGVPLRRDALFLANHTSWLDILTLAGATGTAFVAKGELDEVPLIGWLCRLNGTVFVARADRMGVAAQVAKVRDALADGWTLTLFPEGTTEGAGRLLPFKAALLAGIDPPPPGVRVQPVHIGYGHAVADIAWTGDESGIANVLRVLSRPGTVPVRLTFLDPFDPAAVGNRKAVAHEARARIAAAMPA